MNNLLKDYTAKRIRTLRRDRKLTQRQVANAIDITERHYQRWEAGTSLPEWDNVEKLAEFFKVEPASIVHPRGGRKDDVDRVIGELLREHSALEARVETLAEEVRRLQEEARRR